MRKKDWRCRVRVTPVAGTLARRLRSTLAAAPDIFANAAVGTVAKTQVVAVPLNTRHQCEHVIVSAHLNHNETCTSQSCASTCARRMCIFEGLALPRASHSGEIAAEGSLGCTLAAAPAHFTPTALTDSSHAWNIEHDHDSQKLTRQEVNP